MFSFNRVSWLSLPIELCGFRAFFHQTRVVVVAESVAGLAKRVSLNCLCCVSLEVCFYDQQDKYICLVALGKSILNVCV